MSHFCKSQARQKLNKLMSLLNSFSFSFGYRSILIIVYFCDFEIVKLWKIWKLTNLIRVAFPVKGPNLMSLNGGLKVKVVNASSCVIGCKLKHKYMYMKWALKDRQEALQNIVFLISFNKQYPPPPLPSPTFMINAHNYFSP